MTEQPGAPAEERKQCPVPKCLRTQPVRFAVCKRHWDEAPNHLRQRVVQIYNASAEARYRELWPTPEYLAAVNDLILAIIRQREGHAARSPEVA